MTLDECDHHFARVRAAASLAEACHAFAPLFDAYEQISLQMVRGSVFWRARKAGDRPWQTIDAMGCPPASVVRAGRLNDEHNPCFYAAARENTALHEIGVQVGDFVQIAGFRVMHETPVHVAVVGEMHHVQMTGYLRIGGVDPGLTLSRQLNAMALNKARAMVYIDAFLASLLADVNARKSSYILSRAIASMIYANGKIDGIMFPSVRDLHGMNLALKKEPFAKSVHAVRCCYVQIKQLHDFGFVSFDVLQDAEQQMEDGALLWKPGQANLTRFFHLSKEEYEAATANPRDPNAYLDAI